MLRSGKFWWRVLGGYRYGFNGKENDKDISEGTQDYGMRISDSRLGRFLSVDLITKKYPELTPYQFASKPPIQAIDLDGMEMFPVTGEDFSGDPKKLPKALQAQNASNVEHERKAARANPTIKHISGGVGQSGIFNAGGQVFKTFGQPLMSNYRVSVSSQYGSSGLQVVQFVNATPIAGGIMSAGTPSAMAVQQITINGHQRTAFVDGGKNSPIALRAVEGAPRVMGKPYEYNYKQLSMPDKAGATWNANEGTGAITSFDMPTASVNFREIKFETYFVLTNYAGTTRDKIVGRLDWGYRMDNHGKLQYTGPGNLIQTDKFSANASTIMANDYKGVEEYKPIK